MILFLVNFGACDWWRGLYNIDGENHRGNKRLAARKFSSKQQNKPFAWIYGNPIATRHVDGLLHQAKVRENQTQYYRQKVCFRQENKRFWETIVACKTTQKQTLSEQV